MDKSTEIIVHVWVDGANHHRSHQWQPTHRRWAVLPHPISFTDMVFRAAKKKISLIIKKIKAPTFANNCVLSNSSQSYVHIRVVCLSHDS